MTSQPRRDDRGAGVDIRQEAPAGIMRLLPFVVPVVLLLGALILPGHMLRSAESANITGLGPGAWPGTMLTALAFFAALWILRDLWAFTRPGGRPMLSPPQDDEIYRYDKALGGMVMIVVYGFVLPITGFAATTVIFIALWCLFGGLRNLYVVVPVTLLGTIGLLWLFMGLALMPLPRGQGVFGDFSVWLLRITGIY